MGFKDLSIWIIVEVMEGVTSPRGKKCFQESSLRFLRVL